MRAVIQAVSSASVRVNGGVPPSLRSPPDPPLGGPGTDTPVSFTPLTPARYRRMYAKWADVYLKKRPNLLY